ncbi:PIN domain nuclease [Streptomyces sp. A3M-1-3]|uniref:PIN domain nuclease n=1 Tax=Streptomyces sp. A3M-1-3 TaxID=2962044 RepID=UPI0020B77432|nr:PIN domain nuclease [Streptomyces sp. A3M-1-3]MCP3819863.1 PIN domain nuclease [Streptomyces sp. A3M-1-3]
MRAAFLVDKSALYRWGNDVAAELLDDLEERGLLAICAPIEYEMVYSARNKEEATRLRSWLRGFDYAFCNEEQHERALAIQNEALTRGFHRALSFTDLLIAAVAEHEGLTILHYDGDFDMIAEITGQWTRWVAEPGTAD